MCLILYGHEHHKYSKHFDQLFRLRYDVFVTERKWSLPSRNNFEIDQYDTDDAIYFISYEQDGSIEAFVRLTPTMHSSLLADYFPHLIENGEAARSPTIYETTRFIIQPKSRTREAIRRAKVKLLASLLEWCLQRKLSHFQSVVDAASLNSYVAITPHTRVLGFAHPFGGGRGVPGGGDCIALRWPVIPEVLDDIKAYGNQPRKFVSNQRREVTALMH